MLRYKLLNNIIFNILRTSDANQWDIKDSYSDGPSFSTDMEVVVNISDAVDNLGFKNKHFLNNIQVISAIVTTFHELRHYEMKNKMCSEVQTDLEKQIKVELSLNELYHNSYFSDYKNNVSEIDAQFKGVLFAREFCEKNYPNLDVDNLLVDYHNRLVNQGIALSFDIGLVDTFDELVSKYQDKLDISYSVSRWYPYNGDRNSLDDIYLQRLGGRYCFEHKLGSEQAVEMLEFANNHINDNDFDTNHIEALGFAHDLEGDNMSKNKFYAVKQGYEPGIYNTWEECQEQISGFSGAQFKSFKTMDEAQDYLGLTDSVETELNEPYAFVDGSFNPDINRYGWGGFLCVNGEKHLITGSGTDPEMASMRNVAGEINGAMAAVKMAEEMGLSELNILYDYRGIEHWVDGSWSANKQGTLDYAKFMNSPERIVKINFEKVDAHTGIEGNEIADVCAKDACYIELTPKQKELLATVKPPRREEISVPELLGEGVAMSEYDFDLMMSDFELE